MPEPPLPPAPRPPSTTPTPRQAHPSNALHGKLTVWHGVWRVACGVWRVARGFAVLRASQVMSSTDGRRALLQNLPWAKGLSKKECDALAFASKPVSFAAGEELYASGSRAKNLYLVIAGGAKLMMATGGGGRARTVLQASAGDVLGEVDMLGGGDVYLATATASQEEGVICLQLGTDEYLSLAPSRTARTAAQATLPLPVDVVEGSAYSLDQLHVTGVFGSGAFAQVALVLAGGGSGGGGGGSDGGSRGYYALKKMSKLHLESEKVTAQTLNERFVLAALAHPFIVRLLSTFRSERSLYMLLEPCFGGELFTRMTEVRRMDEG